MIKQSNSHGFSPTVRRRSYTGSAYIGSQSDMFSMDTFKERFLPWVILLAVLLVYLAFPTKNYYWDGIAFAQTIENSSSLGADLIHANHLIYNAFGYLIYKFALGIGFHVRAVSVLQVTNSILSALCAFTLFHILKISIRSTYLAAVLTLLFSFSATWWKFSTDVDAYIISVLFLLISFYLVLPNHAAKPFLVALTHAVSMGFHQLAVFFFPVIALGIFLQSSSLTLRDRLWRIAQYGGATFLITFGSFYFCYRLQTASPDFRSFIAWLTSYSPETGFVFNLKDCVLFTVRGHFRLFFGGRFNFLKEVINPFTIILTGILILACILFVIQVIRKRQETLVAKEKETDGANHYRQLALLCAVWAITYLVFLFFWIPQNTFYRLFYLPSLIVLTGILLRRYENIAARRRRAALLTIIIALSNFLFLIYPYAHVRKNTPLSLALEMNNIWSPQTVIYYSQRSTDSNLLSYFNPAATWNNLESYQTEEFENELRRIYANGGAAWLETSAFNQIARQEEGQQWLTAHSKEQSKYKLTDPAYDVRVVQIFPRSDITNSGSAR